MDTYDARLIRPDFRDVSTMSSLPAQGIAFSRTNVMISKGRDLDVSQHLDVEQQQGLYVSTVIGAQFATTFAAPTHHC